MKRNIWHKVALVFLGICVFVICAEILLSFLGIVLTSIKKPLPNDIYDREVIVCLGDSFTYGMGAPKSYDYPHQLDVILRENEFKKYLVINNGLLGANTAEVFDALRNNAEAYHPSIIIVLAGINNYWNYSGYPFDISDNKWISLFQKKIKNLHVFKVYEIICKRFKDRFLSSDREMSKDAPKEPRVTFTYETTKLVEGARQKREAKKSKDAIALYKKALMLQSDSEELYYQIARTYFDDTNYAEAERWYLAAHDKFADDSRVYRDLASIYKQRGNIEEAMRWVLRGLEADGERKDMLFHMLADIGVNYKNKDELIALLRRYGRSHKSAREAIRVLERGALSKWVEQDLRSIVAYCRSQRIRIVLSTYPAEYKECNRIIKAVAESEQALLVDTEELFNVLPNQIKQREFTKDGHCNAEGYKRMAEGVFIELRDNNLLNYSDNDV